VAAAVGTGSLTPAGAAAAAAAAAAGAVLPTIRVRVVCVLRESLHEGPCACMRVRVRVLVCGSARACVHHRCFVDLTVN
jgi:hypothetical protein